MTIAPSPSAALAPLVLLVEDGGADARMLCEMLRHGPLPSRVEQAERAGAALARLAAGGVDVVLLDLGLPDAQGLEAFDLVHRAAPDLPVVIVSGRDDESLAAQAVRADAQDYLVKGAFDGRVLARVLRYALERKRADAELLGSRRLMQAIIDNCPSLIYALDAEGRFVLVNDTLEVVLGVGRGELLGRTREAVMPHDVAAQHRGNDQEVLASGRALTVEEEHPQADGVHTYLSVKFPLPPSDEGASAVGGVSTDITGRKDLERRLAELTQFSREIIADASDGIVVLDAHLRYEVWNPAMEVMSGVPAAAVLGRHPDEVFPELGRQGLTALMRQALAGEAVAAPDLAADSPRGPVWTSGRLAPLRDAAGAIVGVIGTVTDITTRKQTELALLESEARYRALAEATSDAIVVLENGVIREINRPFTDVYGYTADEVIGRPALEIVVPESRAKASDNLERAFEGTSEIRLRARDGSERVVAVTARMQRSGGRALRLLALQDLTDKRLLEQRVLQAQKMDAVGRLAGTVAHDFNNVLAAIGACVELAREVLPPDHEARADLDTALASVRQGRELARQLLDFSRPPPSALASCDVNEVLIADEHLLRRVIGPEVTYVARLGPTAPVQIGEGQLRQIVMNLVINARDAMPQGGTLTITTGEVMPAATLDGAERPDAVRCARLEVRDTGVGMEAAVLTKVFEPFFTTKEWAGTGLGLASVYGIVSQAGGRVDVQSAPGLGAAFEVLLPLARAGGAA